MCGFYLGMQQCQPSPTTCIKLRTWFVAYGVGAPVILLTNDSIREMVKRSGDSRLLATLFLAGVAAQVAVATINKTAFWICYYGEDDQAFKTKRRYRVACWVAEQFWIDFIADIATSIAFLIATWIIVVIVAS